MYITVYMLLNSHMHFLGDSINWYYKSNSILEVVSNQQIACCYSRRQHKGNKKFVCLI